MKELEKIKQISAETYSYELPAERIAMRGLALRDRSRLLHYHEGKITDKHFHQLAELLAPGTLLVFNTTRVIPARLGFQNKQGVWIEIFLLEPFGNLAEISLALSSKKTSNWKCFIGNLKKWKEKTLTLPIPALDATLSCTLEKNLNDAFLVKFSWEPESLSFAEILEAAGKMPLPPYIKRETEPEDKNRYQTIYAKQEGSVAAPTAGLHFTPELLRSIHAKGIKTEELLLHVGAGTFKPIKTGTIGEHEMHEEKLIVKKETIEVLLTQQGKNVAAVGTTSLRTLESLYWFGKKLIEAKKDGSEIKTFFVAQWEPYAEDSLSCSVVESLQAVLDWMKKNNLKYLNGSTQIMIVPGYDFKIVNALITNFHQPGSTLLLLVAAFTGDDWRKIYDYALTHGYRFLSYGDSSLLVRN